jgi:two-component sensor histidine kinase
VAGIASTQESCAIDNIRGFVMSGTDGTPTPVVEAMPDESEAPAMSRALKRRIRQQEILAELGVTALQGARFDQLLDDTARLTAEGMQAEFCKVLEHTPADDCFLVRAGVGWDPGIVGVATIGADLASPAGFALRTGKPVISNHLENEERFRTPELLVRHGIHRAMNVILQGDGKPFGVLEVDSRDADEFGETDLAFLQGAANILGMAIERERSERNLKAALTRQQILLREITHRVKNSLAIVASMLNLQAADVKDPEVTRHLEDAAHRVSAVAKAHQHIHQGDGTDQLDLGIYVEQVCRDLNDAVPHCNIEVETEHGIDVLTDRAIPIALITNELITNAAKYAYERRAGGNVRVRLRLSDDGRIILSICDDGIGLPAEFDPRSATGLGMRIVRAFLHQLNAEIAVRRLDPGTEFIISVPHDQTF